MNTIQATPIRVVRISYMHHNKKRKIRIKNYTKKQRKKKEKIMKASQLGKMKQGVVYCVIFKCLCYI